MLESIEKKHWVRFYCIVVILNILLVAQMADLSARIKMAVLDVGQGDAILIQTPEKRNVLIDGGPDGKTVEQLGGQIGFFDKTIDLAIITHPHFDHFGGFFEVMKQYRIRRVLISGTAAKNPLYSDLLRTLKAEGAEIFFADSATDWRIAPNLYLDILYPITGRSLIGQEVKNENNVSVVARLIARERGGWRPLMILPGDAEREEEREILLSGQEVVSDVLKAGHHGSRTSSSLPFLNAVRPREVAISAGRDNAFGHPHPETLQKLKETDYWITAERGAAVFWY